MPNPGAPTDSSVQVSVVVCTRNRPTDLARCLPTILANDYANFEVMVVDQSTDHLSEAVVAGLQSALEEKHGPVGGLIYIRMDAQGLSLARNEGAAHARAETIAFTDDDCTVPPDWVRCCAEVMRNEPDAGMVFGALIPIAHDPRAAYVPFVIIQAYRRLRGGIVRVNRIGAGANMVVRRSVFSRIGGFDPWLGPGAALRAADDCDFAYRLLRTEFVLIQNPASKAIHWGARDYSSGAARRILADYFYSVGACYSRHAVQGDLLAAYLLVQEVVICALQIARQGLSLQRREPLGVRRLWYLILGAIQGPKWPAAAPPIRTRANG